MDKESRVVPTEPRVKESMRQAYSDLNVPPFRKRLVDLNKQPEEDVPQPLELYVELSIRTEDMGVLREKYRFMDSSPPAKEQEQHKAIPLEQGMKELPANESKFKSLGFRDGTKTQMFTRNKKVQLPRNSTRALGRLLFNKGYTRKDQKNDDDNDDDDHLASKRMLREFMEQAKARARMAKEKGTKVQPTSVVHHQQTEQRKKKAPKIRSIKDIEEATKDKCVFI